LASEVILTLTLYATASLYALWRGGPPERFAAKIIIVWMMVDLSYHLIFGPSGFVEVDPAHLLIDGLEMAALIFLALRANRIWPVWAAAAQVMTFSAHVVALIDPGGMTLAYWAMVQLPLYIQLFALVCGAAFHARRFRRIGHYRSWRTS
jgi:hypothetical protein